MRQIVDRSRSKLSSSFSSDAPTGKSEGVKMIDPREAEGERAVDESISSALNGSQIGQTNFGNQFNQAFTPGAYDLDRDDEKDKEEKEDKKENTEVAVVNPPVVAPADSKMADLMKRLASAEEKVDKMKAAMKKKIIG